MKSSSAFPDWFKNILIGFGVFCILYIVANFYAKHIPFIMLIYPLILYFVLVSENGTSENWQPDKARHYTNVSLSIIGFFVLIQLVKWDYYIDNAGKLIIGANIISITDSYTAKICIYIFTLIYFISLSIFLTIKLSIRIESFEGVAAFRKGREFWKEIFPIINGKYAPENKTEEQQEKEMLQALNYFDIAIKKKYETANCYAFRGTLLFNLKYYFDALEDYNTAIEKKPEHDKAFNYYMRSLIKDSIYDYEGSLADIDEAIRISKEDTDDNKLWNSRSQKQFHMDSFASFCEFFHRDTLLLCIELEKRHPTDRTAELKKIKRRHK